MAMGTRADGDGAQPCVVLQFSSPYPALILLIF